MPRSCSFNILIEQLSCGSTHSALVTGHGHLYMMGENTCGQLGVVMAPEVRTGSPCLVESLKTHRIERISCGKDFTVAVTRQFITESTLKKSSVYAWGNNQFGQLAIE